MSKKRNSIPYDGMRRDLISAQKQLFSVRNRLNFIYRKFPMLRNDFFFDTILLLEDHLNDSIDNVSELMKYITDAECTRRVLSENE